MDDRLTRRLDELVKDGMLADYDLVNISEDGEEGKFSENRNTEKLTLVFRNGKSLNIGTFCSGSAENTVLLSEE